jgi:polysaccharide biosynthesis/export protein
MHQRVPSWRTLILIDGRVAAAALAGDIALVANRYSRRSRRSHSLMRALLHAARSALYGALWCVLPAMALCADPPPAAQAATTSAEYLIGPGDTLQVFVWRNPELSVTVPVRPDGRISTPLDEDMAAVGKTPTQLARDIEKVLSEYVRSPQVNVIVTQPESAFSQVKVIGQVVKPAPVAYREGMTVLDAVLAVGGLTAFAAGNRARLVRAEEGKQVEIPIKLDSLMNKGDMSQNLKLKPGDVLVVPESRF